MTLQDTRQSDVSVDIDMDLSIYAEKHNVDERINLLMLKLEKEELARLKIETQLKEVQTLSNKVKKLDALNEIFGAMDDMESGLTTAQNREAMTKNIENFFKNMAVTQNMTDETVRELVLQVQLILEQNNMTSSKNNTPSKSLKQGESHKSSRIDDQDVPVSSRKSHPNSRRSEAAGDEHVVQSPAACCIIC